jgi:hypothetical protein
VYCFVGFYDMVPFQKYGWVFLVCCYLFNFCMSWNNQRWLVLENFAFC